MKRGVYEIFTTLFFLIIILLVIFLWLNVSSGLTVIKAGTGEKRLETSLVKEALDDIIVCNGGQVIEERNIPECIINQEWDFIKAVKVVQEDMPGCPYREWGESAVEAALRSTNNNMYTYWVSVSEESHAGICLAKMVMVI